MIGYDTNWRNVDLRKDCKRQNGSERNQLHSNMSSNKKLMSQKSRTKGRSDNSIEGSWSWSCPCLVCKLRLLAIKFIARAHKMPGTDISEVLALGPNPYPEELRVNQHAFDPWREECQGWMAPEMWRILVAWHAAKIVRTCSCILNSYWTWLVYIIDLLDIRTIVYDSQVTCFLSLCWDLS